MAYVLINHGWTNTRPERHWQRLLASTLRTQGHIVSYAQYPNTEMPTFSEWSALLIAELELLVEQRALQGPAAGSDELILIGHSLGCLNIMKTALDGRLRPELTADRILLVAPSAHELLEESTLTFQFDVAELRSSGALQRAAKDTTIIASDEDSWLPRGIRATYTDILGIEPVIVPGAKHFALGDGWGH